MHDYWRGGAYEHPAITVYCKWLTVSVRTCRTSPVPHPRYPHPSISSVCSLIPCLWHCLWHCLCYCVSGQVAGRESHWTTAEDEDQGGKGKQQGKQQGGDATSTHGSGGGGGGGGGKGAGGGGGGAGNRKKEEEGSSEEQELMGAVVNILAKVGLSLDDDREALMTEQLRLQQRLQRYKADLGASEDRMSTDICDDVYTPPGGVHCAWCHHAVINVHISFLFFAYQVPGRRRRRVGG